MEELLNFINRLEKSDVHYSLNHHREEYIMVKIDIPGERWEVEFSDKGEVLIEIFKNSDGLHMGKNLLEDIFHIDNGIGFQIHLQLKDDISEENFLDTFVKEVIEPLGFAIGGNPLSEDGAFITMFARGDVRQNKLDEFNSKLKEIEAIKHFELGELAN